MLSFDAAEDRQRAPGGCPSDHDTTYLFFFIDIRQKIFFFVDVWHCFGLQETEPASANERPNLHSLLDESGEPAVSDVVAVEG